MSEININFKRFSICKFNAWVSFLLLPIPIILASCNFFSKKDKDAESITFKLPKASAIDPAISNQLSSICAGWYESVLKRSGFNGGIIVAKSGNIIFEKYDGFTNHTTKDSITANTPLHIASVSKTFTAMSVLKLWQDKQINIDDEFSKYFPDFNYQGVTVRSLLCHRSGLPNYVYFMDEIGWDKKKYVTNQDILNTLITQKNSLKNINPPNSHFTYCNTNYALLALLVEKISGLPFPQYLKKQIFEPLTMSSTFVYNDADSSRTNPSYNFRGQEEAFMNLDKVYGDKNVFSTPQDLLKWDRLLHTEQFLTKATLEEAYKPYSNEKPGIRNYGLGWRMYNFSDGKKIIYHNGWWHGSNAVFIRLVDEDATIIVIGNKYNRCIYKAKDLIGLFFNSITSINEDE